MKKGCPFWASGLSLLFPPNLPACLALLTFLVLGELFLQILQFCADLTFLGLCIGETLLQLQTLLPQVILGKEGRG